MYVIIHRASQYFKQKNANKYFAFASGDEKNILAKYAVLWNKIEYLIKTIDNEKEIGKDLLKIKIDTDDELPLNKLVNIQQ